MRDLLSENTREGKEGREKQRMNNERGAVIVLSGMRQMSRELADKSRRADAADRAFNREIQLAFHLGEGGGNDFCFYSLSQGIITTPPDGGLLKLAHTDLISPPNSV